MSKQVRYLILFNERNRCCFSLFRVFVYVKTKWDPATIPKVQLWLLWLCPLNPLSNAMWRSYDSREFHVLLYPEMMPVKMAHSLGNTCSSANPEVLILNEKWRKMLQSPIYQSNLFGIVADEAHVIPKWYVGECCCGLNLLSF